MTLPTADVSPQARRDIRNHVLWLRQEAGAEIATRFARQAISSFSKIAETPGVDGLVRTVNPAMTGLRKWRITGFPRYLIFYRATVSGIEVLRIAHTASDWWALLDVN